MQKFDAIIIGFGKGGKTLAAALAKKGESVALIEKSPKMYGGTCINVGCIPSKKLVEMAKKDKNTDPWSYYQKAIAEKNQLVSFLRGKNYDMLSGIEGVKVFDGEASFVDDHHVKIQMESGSETIFGEKIFINTGSTPRVSLISGLENSNLIYTSADLMNLESFPEKLTILGAGYIGLEFASMYADFGTQVTIINKYNDILPNEEPEIVELIKQEFAAKWIVILNNANLLSGKEVLKSEWNQHLVLSLQVWEEIFDIDSDGLLLATGRVPNVQNLGLDNAGVELSPQGAIKVNEYLQTSKPHIFALWDVNGGPQFTYVSLDDSRVVLDYLYGSQEKTTQSRWALAYSLFLSTPFARVGMTEADVKKQGIDYKALSLPVAAIPKARIVGKTNGLFKAIINIKTHEILGASLYGEWAPELINIVSFAMKYHLPYTSIRDHIFTHPTLAESLNGLFKF